MKRIFVAAVAIASVAAGPGMGASAPSTLHAPREVNEFVLAIAKPTAEARIRGNQEVIKAVTLGRNANKEAVVTSMQILDGNQQPEISQGSIALMLVHHKGQCQLPQGDEWRALEKGIIVFVVDSTGTNIWEIGYERGKRSIRLVRGPNQFGPAEEFNIDPNRYRTYACDKYH